MKSPKLSRGLLAAGVLLVLLAFAWPYILPKGMLWDDARAVELTKASEALHETMHAHGHGHDHDHFGETDADDDPEVVAAAKKYRETQTNLDSAKFWTNSMPVYLRWSGLGICAVGVVVYFATREK
jgi:hypothetical protein